MTNDPKPEQPATITLRRDALPYRHGLRDGQRRFDESADANPVLAKARYDEATGEFTIARVEPVSVATDTIGAHPERCGTNGQTWHRDGERCRNCGFGYSVATDTTEHDHEGEGE